MAHRCQFINCPNTDRSHALFRFPVSDKNRLWIWINNSGNINLTSLTPDQLKYCYLCEVHFESCYKNYNDNQRRLTGTAIPRHYHCENQSINVISSVSVEHPMQGTEVTPKTSPEKLKVLTPKKVYCKKSCHILDVHVQEEYFEEFSL